MVLQLYHLLESANDVGQGVVLTWLEHDKSGAIVKHGRAKHTQ